MRPPLAIDRKKFKWFAKEILQDLTAHKLDPGPYKDPNQMKLSTGAANTLQRAAEKYLTAIFCEASKIRAIRFIEAYDKIVDADVRRRGNVGPEDAEAACGQACE